MQPPGSCRRERLLGVRPCCTRPRGGATPEAPLLRGSLEGAGSSHQPRGGRDGPGCPVRPVAAHAPDGTPGRQTARRAGRLWLKPPITAKDVIRLALQSGFSPFPDQPSA